MAPASIVGGAIESRRYKLCFHKRQKLSNTLIRVIQLSLHSFIGMQNKKLTYRRDSARRRPLCLSKSFTITDLVFKPECHLPLVNNVNFLSGTVSKLLRSVSHTFAFNRRQLYLKHSIPGNKFIYMNHT